MEWNDGVTKCIKAVSVLPLSLLADVQHLRITIQYPYWNFHPVLNLHFALANWFYTHDQAIFTLVQE